MHDNIDRIPFLIRLSRRMAWTIRWNIAFGLAFNTVAVLASGAGMLTPIMGAIVRVFPVSVHESGTVSGYVRRCFPHDQEHRRCPASQGETNPRR